MVHVSAVLLLILHSDAILDDVDLAVLAKAKEGDMLRCREMRESRAVRSTRIVLFVKEFIF